MPKKISDDFTQTLRYRNDLSRVKKSKDDSNLKIMDYIFIMEKQIQDLYKKSEYDEIIENYENDIPQEEKVVDDE